MPTVCNKHYQCAHFIDKEKIIERLSQFTLLNGNSGFEPKQSDVSVYALNHCSMLSKETTRSLGHIWLASNRYKYLQRNQD